MKFFSVAAAMACFGLGACTSLTSMELFPSKPTSATLTIESDPPGAEARLSVGGTCRTPCSLPVPVGNEITVNYALNGYLPQTVTVRSITPQGGTFSSPPPALDPNPVYAELHAPTPVKPSPPPPRKKRKPRPPAGAAPVAAAPAEAPVAAAPSLGPPPGGFAPPPGTFTPMR